MQYIQTWDVWTMYIHEACAACICMQQVCLAAVFCCYDYQFWSSVTMASLVAHDSFAVVWPLHVINPACWWQDCRLWPDLIMLTYHNGCLCLCASAAMLLWPQPPPDKMVASFLALCACYELSYIPHHAVVPHVATFAMLTQQHCFLW